MNAAWEKKFSGRVHQGGECLIWAGATDKQGYGRLYVDGQRTGAHRLSLALATGEAIPSGMVVCHRCDTPRCVNPAHLFVGTRGDNNRDMFAKGRNRNVSGRIDVRKSISRSVRGSRHPRAILTEADIPEMRRLLSRGLTQREVGEMFGVAHNTVSQAVRGKKWRHVAP